MSVHNAVLVHRAPERFKKEKTVSANNAWGYQRVSDGALDVELEVWIDWVQLLREQGRRAAFNKAGKSRGLNGAVVVKVVSRKEVQS